ncbi:MAG: hypothetical protein GY765_38985 [bacterium]|nr:hypothetical protein [bacterium]
MKNIITKSSIVITAVLIAVSLLILFGTSDAESIKPATAKPTTFKNYEFTGPFSYKNLSIFLVHGKDSIKADKILTLEEAMAKKKIVVHETSDVNQLVVENKSKDSSVFIQSGDIVKGGKQDRVMQYDVVVPPGSKQMKVASYCVESGRWERRGKESTGNFSSSNNSLVSKRAKLKAKHKGSQSAMWNEVSNAQSKLRSNLYTVVKSKQSESSLQLTLENKKLKKETERYVKHLEKIIAKRNDTVGFAFAINNELNSADMYSSKVLFKKLWSKALFACATEAISEIDKNKKNGAKPPAITDVVKWLTEAEKGRKKAKAINDKVEMTVNETDENVAFETMEKDAKTGRKRSIHKNYIKKSKEDKKEDKKEETQASTDRSRLNNYYEAPSL